MTELQNISWPGWEVVTRIGSGSFGTVYEIQRDVFGDIEKAALKVISIPQNASDIDEMYSDGYDNESITSTFQSHLKSIVAEYSLMRKMNGSSNIVNCDDVRYVQHDDGIGWDIFIKMELLTPLPKALPAEIQEETVLAIARDMCAALALCKKHEIIHRDIKPQNIFVSSNGDYKLGDFGIAKTVEKTTGGTKIGTYKYMAPEVYNNQPYGSGADIYSLGLVLYWLLNDRRMPFLPLPPARLAAGMEETARLRRLSGEQIPAPKNGSEALKEIVLKACAYKPEDRYQSAAEMLEALTALSADHTPKAKQMSVSPPPSVDDTDGTVGPVWKKPDAQEEETVGPDWKKAEKKEEQLKQPEQPEKPKRKWLFPVIAGLLVIAILITMLRFCGNGDTPTLPSDGPSTSPTPVVLTDIAIVRMPNKTNYSVGEILDTTGLKLKLTYSDGSTKIVTSGFTSAPTKLNTEGTQTITITYSGRTDNFELTITAASTPADEPAADSTLSIKDAVALALSKEHNVYTTGKYYVTGTITEIYNPQYGNMKITDGEGNILTIYGVYSADGTLRYDAMEGKPVAGDSVTIYGVVGQYNDIPQIKNGWIVKINGKDLN